MEHHHLLVELVELERKHVRYRWRAMEAEVMTTAVRCETICGMEAKGERDGGVRDIDCGSRYQWNPQRETVGR